MTEGAKKTTTVWVVETGLGFLFPMVVQYEACEVRETSFTCGGTRRTFVVRQAVGRRFFTSKAAMLNYCRSWIQHERDSVESRLRRYESSLAEPELGLEVKLHGSAMRPSKAGSHARSDPQAAVQPAVPGERPEEGPQ